MRTISSAAQAHMQKQHGCEPMFIVGVRWSAASQEILYADQEVPESEGLQVRPQVVEISEFDAALKISGSSDSQSISIVLDDVDGALKLILDTVDIHNATCNIYQHFKGLSLAHKFLLFQGKIVTPVEWDEGARTLRFDVMTQLDEIEVGFSMEEGHFPHIPEDALGKVWPLVFGSVCNMQAVQVRSPRRGTLLQGEGIVDFTLPHRICQAQYIQCPSVPAGEKQTLTPNGNGGYTFVTAQSYAPDRTCVESRFNTFCELTDLLAQQQAYEHTYLLVRGGENFPQGETIVLNVNNAKFWGYFTNETFHITSRMHPEYEEIWPTIVAHPCKAIDDFAYGPARWHYHSGWTLNSAGTTWYVDPATFPYEDCNDEGLVSQTSDGGASASQKYFDEMPTSSFVWLPAGTEVFLEDEAEILYIVSLIPGTVNNVAAYKTQPSGRALLTTVPTDYYTIYETDYAGYQVVEIGLKKPLSLYDANWHDDLYVSFTSDVGPNPVDIIIWLLNKYTNLSYDTTTFNAVRTSLTNYPANFWVKERLNVWQLIQDIAYQARCAVYVRADKVYIVYLPSEPTSIRTLTENDIIAKSLKVVLTPTEEIATKHVITWQAGEAGIEDTDPIQHKIVLKHNIQKYGIHSKEVTYYTQNTYDTILKSATFWMIRDSNVWKKVEFETPLLHLDLDLFDCVTIDLSVFGGPIKGIITNAQYRSSSNTIHFECMTPIKSGETAAYPFFWPAAVNPRLMFPLETEEQYSGAGYDFEVSPPANHILAGGDVTDIADRIVIMTSGDPFPSDLDDTYPSILCLDSSAQEIKEPDPVFEAFRRAANNSYQAADALTNSGVGNGGTSQNKKKRRTACGSPVYGAGCIYEVNVIYVTPDLVANPCHYIGCRHGTGNPCTGTVVGMCHSFRALFAASMFYYQKRAEIDALKSGCGHYQTGVTAPYSLGFAPIWIVDDPTDSQRCESLPDFPGDPNAPGANEGETFEPHTF